MSRTSSRPCFYELDCPVMEYDWGRSGPDALIHRLLTARGRPTDPDRPAAELWMGAHPKAPARLSDGTPLDVAIRRDPAHFLGPALARRSYSTLPFLFKVLDARRPLSIQAHPDRDLAPQLHARDPANYPDDNHKPELAVCLSAMSALVGFRPLDEILLFLRAIPELRGLCTARGSIYEYEETDGPLPTLRTPRAGAADAAEEPALIRQLYSHLMGSSPGEIQEAVQAHRLRLSTLHDGEATREDALFLRLAELYGNRDSGVFSVYFLNYVDLQPDEALFLGPNEPHAYLGGQILECMAASDNVVRAGLTAKFVDVETLLGMLHYRPGHPEIRRPRSEGNASDRWSSYKIDAHDFEVYRLDLSPEAIALSDWDRPAIVLALDHELDVEAWTPDQPAQLSRFPRGSAIYFPGDLAARGCQIQLSAPNVSRAYLATVGPDF